MMLTSLKFALAFSFCLLCTGTTSACLRTQENFKTGIEISEYVIGKNITNQPNDLCRNMSILITFVSIESFDKFNNSTGISFSKSKIRIEMKKVKFAFYD